jgi:cytidine deaminase
MGGSICAERSAITKLRECACDRVLCVYLVSDMATELTPGLLCREFLCEVLELDTPIVMAAAEPQCVHSPLLLSSLPSPFVLLRLLDFI